MKPNKKEKGKKTLPPSPTNMGWSDSEGIKSCTHGPFSYKIEPAPPKVIKMSTLVKKKGKKPKLKVTEETVEQHQVTLSFGDGKPKVLKVGTMKEVRGSASAHLALHTVSTITNWPTGKYNQWIPTEELPDKLKWKRRFIRPSPEYPKESYMAQFTRAMYDIPDDVDVERVYLHNTDSGRRFNGRKIIRMEVMWPGCVVTKATQKKEVIAVVRKVLPKKKKVIVRVWIGEEHPFSFKIKPDDPNWKKEVWSFDTEAVRGGCGLKTEAELKKLEEDHLKALGWKVTVPEPEGKDSEGKKIKKGEKDKWGYRIGSRAANINAVLTPKYQSMKRILKAAGYDKPCHGHMGGLVRKKLVKMKVIKGIKKWRLRKGKSPV